MTKHEDEHDPFARLEHTHRRIEERLDELLAATAELADPVKRFAALGSVRDVVRFFGRAGQKHVEDEERTLFPRLLAVEALKTQLAALEAEHVEHARVEESLRTLVAAWGDEGPDLAGERAVAERARELAALYRAHIRREEDDLFPAARTSLSADTLALMAQEMADRRGGGGGGGGGRNR